MTAVLYLLLAVVALAAAVLSFDALHGLALLCGYAPALAPLLPLVIDAGAAAGSLAWLARAGSARRFGRALALVLLAGSVAGNALGHGLGAYTARPAWWVVVTVSAVPPAVLAAVVHLAVLTGRAPAGPATEPAEPTEPAGEPEPLALLDDRGLSRLWDDAPPANDQPAGLDPTSPKRDNGRDEGRAGELIAAGAGRRRLARELDISEHAARELLAAHRDGGWTR